MINLLPPELKADYQYGRRNVRLRRWVVAFALALVGLGAIGTFGLVMLMQSTKNYQTQVAKSQDYLVSQHYTATQKQVEDISSHFKLVVQVLGKEVLFSELLKQIAATIPKNASLTGLTISSTQGAIDLTASATDTTTATQVQVNLADPDNRIFSKADIQNIVCDASSANDSRYPCTVSIKALFADNNPFLFINTKAGKQ